jgi:hypothetical protein
MEMFKKITLSKEETDIVYSRLSLSGDATLLLQLYAVAADDRRIVTLDNIPQHPFLTEIAYIGFLNSRAEQIWAWKNEKLGKKNSVNLNDRDIKDFVPSDKGTTPPQ